MPFAVTMTVGEKVDFAALCGEFRGAGCEFGRGLHVGGANLQLGEAEVGARLEAGEAAVFT
jgi:hypothetical protein